MANTDGPAVLNARERQRAVWLAALSRALSATVAVTLLVAAFGWIAGIPFLLRLLPDVAPLTSLQGIALAAAVACLEGWRGAETKGRTWLCSALAGLVLGLALLELAGVTGLVRSPFVVGDVDDGLGLLMLALGLAFLGRSKLPRYLGESAFLVAGAVGVVTLVAVLFGTPDLTIGLDRVLMPLPLAYALVALPVAALMAQSESGVLDLLVREDAGGRIARLLLLPAVLLPPVVGYIVLNGQRAGDYDAAFAQSVFAVATMAFCGALVVGGAGAASRASTQLQREQARWRSLLDTVSEPIVTLDADRRIQVANRATELLFERNAQEIVGMAMEDLVVPAQHAALRELLAPGQSGRVVQMEALRRDGRSFPADVSAGTWTGRDGTFSTLVLRDVTRRQMVEQALRGARLAAESAARAKADFLANMSHEIRTPMNAVIGMTQLLGETPLTPEQADYAQTIRASGEHLMTIINDILDFSKIEAGKVELEQAPMDLRRCVQECLEIVAPKAADKKLDVVALYGEGVPEGIIGDLARLRQILLNLLSNAIKFTPKGEVVVQVDAKPLGNKKHEIHLAVRDTGIGIPQDRFDRLFQSFSQVDSSTTRNFGGTGLGLAISKRLVELMGGRIWAESKIGEGSTFQFTLVADEVALPPSATPAPFSGSLEGRHALVVDDSQTNRRMLRSQFQKWGMVVDEAISGPEALELLKTRTYDLAVLDHQMPGMDGVELCQRIRERFPPRNLPLLILSSIGTKPDGYKDPALGISTYLTKPVRQSTLLDAVLLALADVIPAAARQEDGVQAPAQPPVPTARPSVAPSSLRVLLAEDNPVNQKVARKMLERLGVKADLAENGEEAVAAVQAKPYDLVFMDVQMPKMDGLEATRKIRTLTLPTRPHIVAMTAHAMPGDREMCLAAGMDDYITKPVRLETLTAALAKVGVPA